MKFLLTATLAVLLTPNPVFAQFGSSGNSGDWWSHARNFESNFYIGKTDLPEDQAKALLKHMDAVFATYMQFFSKVASKMRWKGSKAKLLLFAKKRDYMQTLSARFDTNGSGSWGLYIPSQRMLVGWRGDYSISEVKRLLQHEGLHQAVHQLFGDIPKWANEGLAELFERGVVVDKKLVIGGFPLRDKKRLLKFHETNELIPFDRFFLISGKEWSARVTAKDAESIYPQAWSLIDFLVYSENRKYEKNFQMFLFGLSQGRPWEKAFTKAYGNINIGQMEEKWLKYIKNKNPTDYELTAKRLEFLGYGMLRLQEENNLPDSMNDLRLKLQQMNFTHVVEIEDEEVELSSYDLKNYQIPHVQDGTVKGFILVDRKFRQPNRNTFNSNPSLLNIVTAGLDPNALVLSWRRSKGKYNFQIEAKPSTIVRIKRNSQTIEPKAGEGKNRDVAKHAKINQKLRVWTSKSGDHKISAVFLKKQGDSIQLKKGNGKIITVPIKKLSDDDQTYLESILD